MVRARAALFASALLVACSAQTPPLSYGDVSPSPSPTHPSPGPTQTNGGSPQPSTSSRATVSTEPGSDLDPTYPDGGNVGEMARTYLRASPAGRMIVEVDAVEGREPSKAVLDHLSTILRRELDKPEGVSVRRGNTFAASSDRYTLEDIDRLERRHRANRSGGATATMWIVYLNGQLSGEPGTLGVAYRASAAAIFADRIGQATTALVSRTAIERAVVTHEAGHLLALVNIGYTSPHDHEDPAHPKHSNNDASVMYWAIEDISIANLLNGGPPSDFDQFDRDDLRLLREG